MRQTQMLLTLDEQKDTLYASARNAGVAIERDEIDWRDEFVSTGELKIHYLDWGQRGKRPLLLLHGGMQTAHTWDITAVAMRRDCHVVAMDLRGHGDSDWSEDGHYGHADHAGDIQGLVRHLGWEHFSLAGLSLGGLASLHFASHHGSLLDALVIVDVGPELSPRGVGRIVDFGRDTGELDSVDDFIEKAVQYNPRRRPEQLRYSLTHNLRQLPNGKWTWKYDRRIARRPEGDAPQQQQPTHFEDMWDALRRIECPTLVVRGAESDVFPEQTAKRMIELLPDGRFVTVPGAGHTVPQDNPAGFLAALRQGRVGGRLSSPLIHLVSRWASLRHRLGWKPG